MHIPKIINFNVIFFLKTLRAQAVSLQSSLSTHFLTLLAILELTFFVKVSALFFLLPQIIAKVFNLFWDLFPSIN